MKVAILDDWSDTVRTLPSYAAMAGHDVTIWHDRMRDEDVLARRLADAEALVLIRERTALTATLLDRLPALRLVSIRGSAAHIDVDACRRNGVTLCARRDAVAVPHAAAELTWALLLAAARDLPRQMASLGAGRWTDGVGQTLRGKTLGIYGWGRIGQAVAAYGRAFGMNVTVWASEASRARATAAGWPIADAREAFFEGCDVISLHLRLAVATRGIVTSDDLARMKPTAILVNTARAELVQPGALVAALRAGRPGMAAVDVFDTEPLTDPEHPLLQLPNLIATPHIGYVTREDLDAQFQDIFHQIVAYDSGRPVNVVVPASGID